jgi:polysaccharide pyruvyl transferase WcaK-like protein
VRARLSDARTAAFLRERLEDIARRRHPAAPAPPAPRPLAGAEREMLEAEKLIAEGITYRTTSRFGWPGRVARTAVLRLLRPYTQFAARVHQQHLKATQELLDSVRSLRERDQHVPTFFVVADVAGPEHFHLGDEAMLEANLDALRRWYPEIRFVASSRDPRWTERRYLIRAMPSPSLSIVPLPEPEWDQDRGFRERSGWLLGEAIVEALRQVDGLIISGGGNLCATWPGKLLERAALLHCAADLGKPAVVVGQTLGPALTSRQSALLGAALRRAKMVGVRDRPSFDLACAFGLRVDDIRMQVDDSFFLEPQPVHGDRAHWLAAGRRWILVTFDPSLGSVENEQRLERLAAQLDGLATSIEADLVFVPHVGGAEAEKQGDDDRAIGRRLSKLLGTPLRQLELWSPREVRWLTGQAALVVSTRYHGLVFATAAGVPALGIYSDDYTHVKLKGALAHAELAGWAIDLDSAARGNLLTAGLELWDSRDDVRRRLGALRERAVGMEQARWERIGDALGLASERVSVAALDATVPPIVVVPQAAATAEERSPRGRLSDAQ